jgi:hypothetical protein
MRLVVPELVWSESSMNVAVVTYRAKNLGSM